MSGTIGIPTVDFAVTRIGNQVWMAEDYRPTHYNNGDIIFSTSDPDSGPSDWEGYGNDGIGAYVYYPFENTNSDYVFYNRYVFTDPRGVLPPGWRLPTLSDVVTLAKYYDPSAITPSIGNAISTIAGDALKLVSNWSSPNTNTNISRFSANSNGYIIEVGEFYGQDEVVYYRLNGSIGFRLTFEDGGITYINLFDQFGTPIRLIAI